MDVLEGKFKPVSFHAADFFVSFLTFQQIKGGGLRPVFVNFYCLFKRVSVLKVAPPQSLLN